MSPDETESTRNETTARDTRPRRRRSSIGEYRLIQKLGEGGMGEVWEAEQERPIRRRVALKIIKRGMDSELIVARFESERQALALMDHENIAKVFEAGTTERGRPYFVMELVSGVPITEHCDTHRLTTRERLDLFRRVCEGVQHAHQKAVIHRDIKPSNVLVAIQDGKPVPKIIDFGVAKATAQPLTERTLFTELGQLVGTPEYMSPEQAEMTAQNIDTRTDVYSLGAVLYELLAGARPFDGSALRRAGFEEIRRILRDVDPPRPSTRISTAGEASTESARRRKATPRSLADQLRGDLDWITMKALEKDRARRYGSPSELSQDIARHLRDEPVLARPPSTTYRVGKFAKRHRVGVLAAGSVIVLLLTFAVTTAIQARRIAQERDRAVDAEARARAINDFLVKDMLAAASPEESLGRDLTVQEVLRETSRKVDSSFGGQPELEVPVRVALGEMFRKLGEIDEAEPHMRRAVELGRRELGGDDARTLEAIRTLANWHHEVGRLEESEPLYREALEGQRRVLGEGHPSTLQTLNDLAIALSRLRRTEEAEPMIRAAYDGRRETLGEDHPLTIESLLNLATVLGAAKSPEAGPVHREAAERAERALGARHPQTIVALNNLAFLTRENPAESESVYRRVIELGLDTYGDKHPDVLISMYNLASTLRRRGRYVEACEWAARTVRAWQEIGAVTNSRRVHENLYGELLIVLGRPEEAESVLREAVAIGRELRGDDHPATLLNLVNLGWAYRTRGRLEEAESCYRETLEGRERALGAEHAYTLRVKAQLGDLVSERGRHAEGEAMIRDALRTARESLGERHLQTAVVLAFLGRVLLRTDRPGEAEPVFREVLDIRSGNDAPQMIGEAQSLLGECLLRLERPEEAEPLVTEGFAAVCRAYGPRYPIRARARQRVIDLYERLGAPEKADAVLAGDCIAETRKVVVAR